ncbi:recombinase RecT [Streptomyces sp. NPDC005483]|uniref:recombinase RecT n=1 Tax=Streptomyces sp. NPDC005483 TaxID=3154882 RepID=UPI0033BE930E
MEAALPKHVSVDLFLAALRPVLPRLRKCTPASVLQAVITCARFGLVPDGQQAAITADDRIATFIATYEGYVELMWRSGLVKSVVAQLVYEGDEYEFVPTARAGEEFVHRPNILASKKDQKPLFAYAFAWLDGGARSNIAIVTLEEAEEIRDEFSKAYQRAETNGEKNSLWHTRFDRMHLKGLALDTPMPTPSGWSTMGGLRVGDEVFDMHGQRVRILATSAVKNLDCYRVTFANGQSIVCDAEHLWVAKAAPQGNTARQDWKVHEIADLYEVRAAGGTVVMPVTEPLDMPDADLPIDPWTLGYWLGDGNRTAPVVTCNADNQHEVIAAITSAGYEIGNIRKDPRSNGVAVYVKSGLGKQLAEAGLIGHKHVPAEYLRASRRQRLALLRGLMDSDGTVNKHRGEACFYNTDVGLAESAAELARSLGEMVRIYPTRHTGYGKTVTAYHVRWKPTVAPVTLSAKLSNFRPRKLAPYRGVKSIDRIPSVPTRCISVDSPTRTFLAGEDMTPTHNTAIRRLAKLVPKSAELRALIAVEDAAEDGKPQILAAIDPETAALETDARRAHRAAEASQDVPAARLAVKQRGRAKPRRRHRDRNKRR